MGIVRIKRIYLKIRTIGEHILYMLHCLKLCNKDCGLFKTQCSILTTVMYVHSPIVGILRQTLLILTIPIKYDVLNVLHDGTGHVIIGK